MADFDTGDIVRLGAVQKYAGVSDIVGVLHLRINAGGGLAFAQASLDFQEYCDTLYALFEAQVSVLQLPEHISVQNVTQSTVWGNIAWDAYDGGTSAADVLAAQTAMLVWGRTAISRVQIRKYLGVLTEPFLTTGAWTAAARAAGLNFINYHIAAQAMTEGLVLQGVAWSPSLSRATTAVSGTTSPIPVTQRRRRTGRGS